MDAMTEASYAVALQDYPGLPEKERIAAEVRYCRTLEKQLGTPDDVAHLMRAVERAAHDDVEPSDEARKLATQWQMANRAAGTRRCAGLAKRRRHGLTCAGPSDLSLGGPRGVGTASTTAGWARSWVKIACRSRSWGLDAEDHVHSWNDCKELQSRDCTATVEPVCTQKHRGSKRR